MNLIPFVRAELALKLEWFFKKKALENQNTCSFDKLVDKEKTPFQKTHNPIDDIKENSMIDNQEDEDIEEELPISRSENNYERAEEALKLKDKISEIKPIDTKKELAKIAGVSHDTISKVKKIIEKAPEEVKISTRL